MLQGYHACRLQKQSCRCCAHVQAPLQKYALVLREKAVQRRAMQNSDELSVPRKASLIDGASDSEEEEEAPMKQSEREDDAQEANEVSSLMVPSLIVPWHIQTLVCHKETQDCLNTESHFVQCGFLHVIMSSAW